MLKKIFKIDQGTDFGKWQSRTARFMYNECMVEILKKIKIPKLVADYGGANGLIKQFIPRAITVDIDASKNPDFLDNILTHRLAYDLVVIRYVMHYLTDSQVLNLFSRIARNGTKQILVIQFCNDGSMAAKRKNSINEKKYFRTQAELRALLPAHEVLVSKKYHVSARFYKERLNNDKAIPHDEILFAALIKLEDK